MRSRGSNSSTTTLLPRNHARVASFAFTWCLLLLRALQRLGVMRCVQSLARYGRVVLQPRGLQLTRRKDDLLGSWRASSFELVGATGQSRSIRSVC
jgi:hypothetical protein